MKKNTAVFLAAVLAACLTLTGCIFGSAQEQQPFPLPSASAAEPSLESVSDSAEDLTEPASGQTPATTAAPVPTTGAPASTTPAGTKAPSGPVGPATTEAVSAEQNTQIMTETVPETESPAHKILAGLNWADTVWADSDDLCHLRITDLGEDSVSFYWHSRVNDYPVSFQSELCTAAFSDNVISCNYEDDQGNTGVVRLTVRDQAISFEQTIVHNGTYSPTALKLTLLPKASGTEAFYFSGGSKNALSARNILFLNAGGSSFQGAVNDYVEGVLGITDVSGNMVYLLDSNTRFYTESELSGYSKDLIRIFKNEIYARHGYRFQTEDIYFLFVRFTWYYPDFSPENFKESVFNQYEKENLKLLVKLEEK